MTADLEILDPWAALRDTYLTDGRRLLRLVSVPDRRLGLRTGVVEDCHTLELRTCRRRELRRLRRLTIAHQRDAGPHQSAAAAENSSTSALTAGAGSPTAGSASS